MSASKTAKVLAFFGGWALLGLAGCCGHHRNLVHDSHNCDCRPPQCQAVPHEIIEEGPVEETVPSAPSENPLIPAPPSGAAVPYERFDDSDEAAGWRGGGGREPAAIHDGHAPRRDPVAEPLESQRSLIPQSFKRPNLLKKLGAPLRHILHRFRNKGTSHSRNVPHVHEHPGLIGPQEIRQPEPVEEQTAVRESKPRPIELPVTDGHGQRLPNDSESRKPLVRLKSPRLRAPAAENSTAWGTHFSRQGHPSSSRSPLMRVPAAPAKIEVWPPRRQQQDASGREDNGIPSLETLGGGHTRPDLQTPPAQESPRTADRSTSRRTESSVPPPSVLHAP